MSLMSHPAGSPAAPPMQEPPRRAALRILYVAPTAPDDYSYGGAMRSHLLLRGLSRVGDVTTLVLTPAGRTEVVPDPEAGVVASITFRHSFLPGGMRSVRKLVAGALEGRSFDVVVVRYMYLGICVRPCVEAPFILDADDLSKRHGQPIAWSGRYLVAALRKVARDTVTRLQLPRYAHVWFVNRSDMAAFPVRAGSMIPNVIAEAAAAATPVPPAPPVVLFVGNLAYGPNIDAVDRFVSQAWPELRLRVPVARLRIVGKRSAANGERWNTVEGVESPGFVDDLQASYRDAAIVIAPVFSGGGTQIKVLEALAHGRATVVSDFVRLGFAPDLQDGVHFVVAETPASWASACADLIEDPQRAATIGAAGREAVRRLFSVDRMFGAVEATFARLERQAAK